MIGRLFYTLYSKCGVKIFYFLRHWRFEQAIHKCRSYKSNAFSLLDNTFSTPTGYGGVVEHWQTVCFAYIDNANFLGATIVQQQRSPGVQLFLSRLDVRLDTASIKKKQQVLSYITRESGTACTSDDDKTQNNKMVRER